MHSIRHSVATLALALLAVVTLPACQTDLHTKLTEHSANQMLQVLLEADIDARKQSPDGKTWTLTVDKDHLGPALTVLRANGLPSHDHTNLGEMFKKDGLISTPTEERVRFLHGISEELAATLSTIDGVVAARVHVVLPNNDPLATQVKPSSASVFIKHRVDVNTASLSPMVKNLVVRSVEGLSHEHVNVTLVATPLPQAVPRPRSGNGVWWIVLSAMGVGALAAAAAVVRLRSEWLPASLRSALARFARQRTASSMPAGHA
jgi:type III secretion protein J